jgi:hypothetical protein
MNYRTLLLISPIALGLTTSKPAPRFEKAFELKPEEGVFAYARISPDGRTLAYASEYRTRNGGVTQTVTVVDLKDKKVVFTEPGIDAYWSNDGQRMIYLSFAREGSGVTMRHHATGKITRDVAPQSLGDYFSWAVRDNKNLILTINSNYYYLDGDQSVMPHARVPVCPDIGRGERPLISHDGMRVTTFVRGTVVIRDLSDCDFTLDTGIQGAKADFSWDNRYVAMHAPKTSGSGYEIVVVDIQQKTVRTVTNLPGSSYFPSWTRDGRLSFRYDGDDYKGFMFAHDVLSAPARLLPKAAANHVPERRTWADLFPETAQPNAELSLVMVWGTWSAHSPMALTDLERARDYFSAQSMDVDVAMANDIGSRPEDVNAMLDRYDIDLRRIPLSSARFKLTEGHNQSPATLLFRNGELIDRRLGAQTFEQLRDWIKSEGTKF